MNNWNKQHLDKLQRDGKIRSYSVTEQKPSSKNFRKRSEEKDWLGFNLMSWCNRHCFQLVEEYQFHRERKWRHDWFISALNVAIEYEGIFSHKSRHTTFKGYSGDTDKYRASAKQGITVLRYTAENYKSVLSDLDDILITDKKFNQL